MSKPATIRIDEVEYVRKDSTSLPPVGPRAVVVVDRGWIWAGDISEKDGRVILSRAVWVLRWEGVGFDGMIANPKSPKVQLRPIANPVDIPAGSEIFRVPVAADWGL